MTARERPFLADSHSHPIPEATLDLLGYVLERHAPSTVVLERRRPARTRLMKFCDDIARIRVRVGQWSDGCS